MDNQKMKTNSENSYDSGMKALSKSVNTAFFILLFIIIFMLLRFITFGGYFTANNQEAVVVLQLGKFKECYTKDWHWYLPYPVNRFIKIKTSPQLLKVNFQSLSTVLATNAAEIRPLVAGNDKFLLTSDGNILHSNWTLTYRVSNPELFYKNCLISASPNGEDEMFYDGEKKLGVRGLQTMLKNFFSQVAIDVSAKYNVRSIYDLERNKFASEVEAAFIKLINEKNFGVSIDGVILDNVTPPGKIAQAFHEVAVAMNTKTVLKNQAEEYSLTTKNQSKNVAEVIIADAKSYQTGVVSEIESEKIYFETINKEYKLNPKTVLMTLYNNNLAEILSGQDNKYIIGSNSNGDGVQQVRIKLNAEAPKKKNSNAGEVK